jgi:hypothetical protein
MLVLSVPVIGQSLFALSLSVTSEFLARLRLPVCQSARLHARELLDNTFKAFPSCFILQHTIHHPPLPPNTLHRHPSIHPSYCLSRILRINPYHNTFLRLPNTSVIMSIQDRAQNHISQLDKEVSTNPITISTTAERPSVPTLHHNTTLSVGGVVAFICCSRRYNHESVESAKVPSSCSSLNHTTSSLIANPLIMQIHQKR